MTSHLKPILLKIARLPEIDQRWIVKHLPEDARIKFTLCDGLTLLKEAKRYRLVTPNQVKPIAKAPELPRCVSLLASKTPLYIALIIEQGNYSWKEAFLKKFDKEGLIVKQLEQEVHDIKPLSKQALFAEWQSNLAFEDLMESAHG